MELPAFHSAYCSQAANKKVTKNSKFLVFEARKKENVRGLGLTFSFNEFGLSRHEAHRQSHKSWLQNLPLESEDTVGGRSQGGTSIRKGQKVSN